MKSILVSFGHSDVVLPLFNNLKKQSVDVDLVFVFALNRKSESVLDFKDKEVATGFLPGGKVEEILAKEIKTYLGDISAVHFFIYYNLKLRSFRNIFLSIKLANKLKNYAVIHFNGTNGVLPLLIFLLRKKKLLFTIHDIHTHSGEKTRFNFGERLNEYIVKSKYPLVIQNHSNYEYLIKKHSHIAEKFYFIPFGVLDIYREFKGIINDAHKSDILFFGRISPYKGIDYLIAAIEKLREKGIHLKTIVAGSGEIYFETAKLDQSGIILINRYIPNNELVGLLLGTKIVICPYTDATQSGVVMTAFAFNKPVIASAVGSFPEVVKDGITGFLVPPRDAEALAAKIELLVSDLNLLNKMENNIRSFANANEYSWPHIASEMAKLYATYN